MTLMHKQFGEIVSLVDMTAYMPNQLIKLESTGGDGAGDGEGVTQ